MSNWLKLGEILLQDEVLSAQNIEDALQRQAQDQQRLGQILMNHFGLSKNALTSALARQFGLSYLPQLKMAGATELLGRLPLEYVREECIFPLEISKTYLRLAMADPTNSTPINDLAALTGCHIEICLAPEEEILNAINRAYAEQAGDSANLTPDLEGGDSDLAATLGPTDLLDSSDEAPIIRFVNGLIARASRERASDIHLEPFETEMIIRYRIDGVLYEVLRPPQKARAAIISRIKIIAGLNIAEKRLPQDGRFRVRIAGRDVDIRVSSLPTAFGERLVLRLLEKSSSVIELSAIGLDEQLQQQIDRLIHQPHGIFLVTGPTGSGKTTTLYAALSRLNDRSKNIITVEDPIEYQLNGVGQIQVNSKIELTFAAGLRSILRQDPDIIMVGEIRDSETAEIAVQSALTGHMVFSTLHTNDAAGALTRLLDMKIEPFLVSSAVTGILAQRLVRKLCPDCRSSYSPSEEMIRHFAGMLPSEDEVKFFRSVGCDSCQQIGYRGRTGIYELLLLTDEIREMLMSGADASRIRQAAQRAGMRSLRQDGLQKALTGETSLEEILRVTQIDN
ncbi:type II secretion system ATPase GspE [Geopsychrobacter electrodiphilus]|uniref:type II secretion system ATPase GspE n=1 Tax=Geopsychrobacter electrodiphilus TaxID=225196 RepID=UPI000360414E|nr:type II secretion system ATPase GspE [Geopsychrobacter electrodiphilus]